MVKRKKRKYLAGLMAAVTILQAVVSPFSTYASEGEKPEKPPVLEEVKDLLDADEVVTAKDYEMDAGYQFDATCDFSGIEIPDNTKVKVSFEEAKSETGENFDSSRVDTYKAVYYVQPLTTDHPKYQVSRKLIVKEVQSEPQTEPQSEPDTQGQSDGGQSEDANGEGDDGDSDIEKLLLPDTDGETASETVSETASDFTENGTEAALDAVSEEVEQTASEETAAEVSALEDGEDGAGTENTVGETSPETESETESDPTTEVAETESETKTEPETMAEDEAVGATEPESETKKESEWLSEEDLDKALEEAETENTTDEESGLTLSDVMEQAAEQEIELLSMEEGETITFLAAAPARAASSTQSVDVTRGSLYYYSDYGLGSYQTYSYTVKFGSVSATAYCIQPSKGSPGDGVYTITKLTDSKVLAKVCYYGTKASGDNGFFAEKYPDFSTGKRFVITHIAAAYANGSSDAFSGANSTGQALAMELYNYCVSQPEIPDVAMSFSKDNVKAYVDGTSQRTEEITFKADALQSVTMKLPDGVKLHNVTTGKTSKAGADVEISGGTKFYLSAPLTQAADVGASWSTTMKGSITKDYSAYKVTTGSGTQDLALVFGEGVDDEKYVDFAVTWVGPAEIKIIKKDVDSGKVLPGAVYGVYSDQDGKNLIATMPATDSNGASSITLTQGNGTVYLKEITPPAGYEINVTAYGVKVEPGKKVEQNVTDKELRGGLTVYKEGESLTGASVSASGVTFTYTKRKQKGATYRVNAGTDIVSALGELIYKKGAVVAEKLTTGDDGSASIGNLYPGSYVVTETGAPATLTNSGESKTVTVTTGKTNAETVFATVTFVNDRKKAKVTAKKSDKGDQTPLAGGIYGLYAGSTITAVDGTPVVNKDTLIEQVTTGSDGSATYKADLPAGFSYYMKELKAPEGYRLNGADVYSFSFAASGNDKALSEFSYTFTNEEQFANLTIYKEGEVLTGAAITDQGTLFQYETRKQPGAVFNLYAGDTIKTASGKTVYEKGALIAENLTTNAEGFVTVEKLHLGTYVVKEMQAPVNLVTTNEEKTVKLTYAGQEAEVALGEVTFTNNRQKAAVSVTKVDNDTKVALAGGIYALYAGEDIKNADGVVVAGKDTYIERVTTGADGTAQFRADLPIGFSYYVKEAQAPELYLRNSDDIFHFSFTYTTDQQASVPFTHTFENERVNAKIDLIKQDAEKGEPQGDATLEHAVYGLFAREDILHPDQKSGVLYKAGEQVATLTTDADGKASITDLYLGKYFVKELTPSTGYLLDETEYDLACDYEGDLVATVEKTCTSKEQVIKQPFQLIKAANNGKTDADLLSGAGFTAYLVSSLNVKEDGSYDFASATPVEIGEGGKTEIFTDEKGYAVSIPIPFGTYVVRETTTPHNFKPVKDFIVRITENNPTTPQVWRVLLDEEFQAKLKIIKQDDETKRSVLRAGTEFKVYDVDHESYVEQVTTYPTTITHTSYFTDEDGYLIMPETLLPGTYRIEEVRAPQDYTINESFVTVTVDEDSMYYEDPSSGDLIIEAVYENHPVKGELTIHKSGEVLEGFDKEFHYKEQSLSGAIFEIFAAEDIYTPDNQKDENGNRLVVYAKGQVVDTVITDSDGKAVIENLPLGTYVVKEKQAPEGFVLNTVPQEVTFSYLDQDTPVVTGEVNFTNDRQRIELLSQKQDKESDIPVEGAVFGLYNKEDIGTGDEVIVEADTLLCELTTDENGQAICTLDLPLARYYVKELTPPAGYLLSDEIVELDGTYQGQNVPVVKLSSTIKNEPTITELTKSDLTTGVELSGASLTVLDKDGNVIDSWTSVKDEPHIIKRLHVGETYILREEFAPYGYLKATDVEFTLTDSKEPTKVEMKDEVPTALLIINKKGEFLDKVSLVDNAKGTVEHIFEYVTGSLTNVTFEVYAAEDIKAADGVSEDYYKKDDLVATITTENNGIAQAENLPAGKYYVKEVETEKGYLLDGEPRYVDLSYRDQDTPVITYDENWQNERQKVEVHVTKKEKGTDRVLPGGIFGLFAKEDILSASGKLLIEKDTIIELKTTDANGRIRFIADLPVGASFYVKELYAPDGFVTENEQQEFTFESVDDQTAITSFEFVFENEPTTVELTKEDLTTGAELPGAHLRVIDENANLVDEWVSTTEPHIIKELVVGRGYTMIETKPADGFVTAESVDFIVENTSQVQKHTMKDDVTKVQISKNDITDSKEVDGAKLTILDENGKVVETWYSGKDPHYIEKLPIGNYTLREETAPEGYVVAEDVEFDVLDSGEIQKVSMHDKRVMGKVLITKTDAEAKVPLAGVEFEIRDKVTGKVAGKLITDENGMAENELLPIGVYEDGKMKEPIVYVLKETKPLDGYEEIEKEEEIVFTCKDDKTEVIEVSFALTNQRKPGVPLPSVPKTGDNTNIWLPVLLAVLSFGGILVLGIRMRRKNKKKA